MEKSTKLSVRIGQFCLAFLASAILSGVGCYIHEENRPGQAQDSVTFLLAGGTYLSLCAFVLFGSWLHSRAHKGKVMGRGASGIFTPQVSSIVD